MSRPNNEKQKPNTVKEQIPEKQLRDVKKRLDKKQQLLQEFLQLSITATKIRQKIDDIYERINDNGQKIRTSIQHAYKKMKLGKKKNYQWRFDGRDSFIGIEMPLEKPKK